MDFKNTDIIAFAHPLPPYTYITKAAKDCGHIYIFEDRAEVLADLCPILSGCLDKVTICKTPLSKVSVMRSVSVSLDDYFENERLDWLFLNKLDIEDIVSGASKVIKKNFQNKLYEDKETHVIYKRGENFFDTAPAPVKLRRFDKSGLGQYLSLPIDEPAKEAVIKLLTRAALDIDAEQNISCVIDAVMLKEISFDEVIFITKRYIWDANKIFALLTKEIKQREHINE